jgi:hypothetical protein
VDAVSEALSRPRKTAQEQWLPTVAMGIAVLLSAALVGWLLLRDDGSPAPAASAAPTLVSQEQLTRIAQAGDGPIYWAGAREGYAYELTVTPGGRVYLRYLPEGAAAGDSRAFLTVGTYPDSQAFSTLQRGSRRSDATSLQLPHGGLAVLSQRAPKSVYLAYPGANYQVEVFDPEGNGRRLVADGAIVSVR